eukprot:3683097-Rhodomonas_salina.1
MLGTDGVYDGTRKRCSARSTWLPSSAPSPRRYLGTFWDRNRRAPFKLHEIIESQRWECWTSGLHTSAQFPARNSTAICIRITRVVLLVLVLLLGIPTRTTAGGTSRAGFDHLDCGSTGSTSSSTSSSKEEEADDSIQRSAVAVGQRVSSLGY